MSLKPFPRVIDPGAAFNELVNWFHDEVILRRSCPGILLGLSGTDSLVAFLAAYRAFEKVGKPHRVYGIHFAPSEDFLDDHPESEAHLWFSKHIIPWIKQQAPAAKVEVSSMIDWRCEGLRTGALADLAVITIDERGQRMMRPSDEKYWLSGTRNRTENILYRYSNVSLCASLQPLFHLWKSEILQISEYLKVPALAVQKSCEVDCICGREKLPAENVRELDLMLMVREKELIDDYIEKHIPIGLKVQLKAYIAERERAQFKTEIPYKPREMVLHEDDLVESFEHGSLDLREFNHRKHLYIAWFYLKRMSFTEALDRYTFYLRLLLEHWHHGNKFSQKITETYFATLTMVMLEHPNADFDEVAKLVEQAKVIVCN